MTKVLFRALVCFSISLSAFGQSDRGILTGTVTDPQGAVIPNASIEITNTQNGARYQTSTTSTGNYTMPSLPVGTYTLTVEVPGFKKFMRQGIQIAVAQVERVDVMMEIGTASQTLVVSADATMLSTENAAHSFYLTSK